MGDAACELQGRSVVATGHVIVLKCISGIEAPTPPVGPVAESVGARRED